MPQKQRDAVEIMAAAMKDHEWPEEVALPAKADLARAIFRKTTYNRPYDAWFDGDLLEVARYARAFAELEEVVEILTVEGWTITTEGRGGRTVEVEHPMLRVHHSLQSTMNQVARRLNLAVGSGSGREVGGSREAQTDRANDERRARSHRTEAERDSILESGEDLLG